MGFDDAMAGSEQGSGWVIDLFYQGHLCGLGHKGGLVLTAGACFPLGKPPHRAVMANL